MKAIEIIEQIKGNANICIAVLDGPVDLTHPCFNKAKITKLETLVSGIARMDQVHNTELMLPA